MKLQDAEDLWLACVCQAPTYADHSLITEQHLSSRARLILDRIRAVQADGWPMVTPDQVTERDTRDERADLRTIPRRMDAVDATGTLPQAERALLEAWATDRYKQALRRAAELCDEKGREEAQRYLGDATQRLQGSTAGLHWKQPGDVAREVLEEIRRSLQEDDAGAARGSGRDAIDRACRGYPPSRCTTIGGWTNEGKSTLALELCTGLSIRLTRTAVISLEDEEKLMAKRQLAMCTAEVAAVARLTENEATAADLAVFGSVVDEVLAALPMDLLYMPGASAERVCYAIQEAARRGARVVVVDYLQCFEARQGEKRSEALGRAARALKAAASQVGVHLVLVSQLRRPSEANARKTAPSMYMFKETGDVENMTEYALLVWRPDKGKNVAIERAKVIVDKAKDGKTGAIDLGWDTVRQLFTLEPPDDADRGQRELGDGGYTYEPD